MNQKPPCLTGEGSADYNGLIMAETISASARVLLLAAALCVVTAVATADTAVMKDGHRLHGEITERRNSVRIRSAAGTLTIPRRRVQRVEVGEEREGKPAPSAEAGRMQAPGVSPPRSAVVEKLLSRRIAVNFEDVSLRRALLYVRELTGVNVALGRGVEEAEPVSLKVRDVPVRTVLERLLEPRGLHCTVRPGRVLYIDERQAVDRYLCRLYPATDLLIDRGDTVRSGGPGDSGGGTALPQFEAVPGGVSGAADGAAQGRGETARRAAELTRLLNGACGGRPWRDLASSGRASVSR